MTDTRDVTGADQWRRLIGQHVTFDLYEPWDPVTWPYDGVLARVETDDGNDPRYPSLVLWGEWGGRAIRPDETVRVTVITKWRIRRCRCGAPNCDRWRAARPGRTPAITRSFEEAVDHARREDAKAAGIDPRIALERARGWSRDLAYPWTDGVTEVTG